MENREQNNIMVSMSDGRELMVKEGTSLLELVKISGIKDDTDILAAKVDNDIKELNFHLNESCRIEFLDLKDNDGVRIYKRSAYFILVKAVKDLFSDRKVVIHHSISKGVYCEVIGGGKLTKSDVLLIEKKMFELVNMKLPFIKKIMPVEEAKEIFIKTSRQDRSRAIEFRSKPYVTIYSCGDTEDYFYGYMVPHTGYIKRFTLKFYDPGLILIFPDENDPGTVSEFSEQKKLFSIFKEYKSWGKILGVENVGDLNEIIRKGEGNNLIRIAEALQEKKIAQIADMVANNRDKKRMILIAGPSSSGKTTTAKRLAIQLIVNGLKPVTVSLDDYFVDRDHTPKDEWGDLDFEALEAIDVPLFNQHLYDLINGKAIEMPIFSFPKGSREDRGRMLKIDENNILIIEGIHGLNEKLTASISKKNKFKIYVSALTSLNVDDHNRIPTTDARILRRIVRDFNFRGCSAVNTIKRWPSVRRGEEKNIFPFQEEADVMFNSSLIYELGVLKTFAEPLLNEIDMNFAEYSEARRLIEFLGYFVTIDNREIPLNSIIREFIGGSCFY